VRPAARASAGGDGGGGHGGRWVEQEGSDGDGGRLRVGVEVWGLISPLSLSLSLRSLAQDVRETFIGLIFGLICS
jgi:hypothetical protein